MNIRTNRIKQIEGPVNVAVRHPCILLLLLFYAVAGIAAGVSAAGMAQSGAGELADFFNMLSEGDYSIFPAILRSVALNLLFYIFACLQRLWPPLIIVGGLSVSMKCLCMGVSLTCLIGELGLRGVAMGVPLCIVPALFCVAALTLRMLADINKKTGLINGKLALRSWGCFAICVLIESAAAPVALRAWLLK